MSAGYTPGIYVGTTMFSATELYGDFGFQHYWQAGTADLPFVDKRGYQLYQRGQATLHERPSTSTTRKPTCSAARCCG